MDLKTDGAELPVEHFLEWLAEWGREVRRRQTGILLLTAHRAKGLEFNHVAVLDGNWIRLVRTKTRMRLAVCTMWLCRVPERL